MKVIKALIASILILHANAIFGVEISGYVKRSTTGPSPASVYANGAKIATASDSGYFQGEVAEGNLEIYAELSLPSGVERSLPKQIYISADTMVQLNIAPLRRVTIRSELPAGTGGPWLTIFEAVTPSEALFHTDLQFLPVSTFPSGGYSHQKSYDLPEGIYRALLSAGTGVSGERYIAWKGFEVTRETKEITITPRDEYSSYPTEVRAIDPARIDFSPDELEGYLRIRGDQGAASPSMALTILNLQTGHYTWGSSKDDGSFSLVLNGLPGSEYAIYQRPEIDGWNNYQLGVGTTIQAPFNSKNGFVFSTEHSASNTNHTPINPSDAKLLGGRVGGIAQHRGEFDFSQLSAGSSGEITGTVDVVGPSLEDVSISWGTSGLYLEKIVSANGWVVAANPENSSNYMTVSGLPINGEPEVNRTQIGTVFYSEIEQVSSTLWRAKFVANYDIPTQLSNGRYQLHLDSSINTTVSSERVFTHNFISDPSTSVLDGRIGEFEIGDTSKTNIDIGLLLIQGGGAR
ncbi:hypothetical protein N9O33_08660 [Gammaproteobacteria bacterium]|nr:hypothetical protein [Gammaproteobacteria bacterium]